MKKKFFKLSVIAFVIFGFLTSCSKDDDITTTTPEPSNQEKALAVMLSLGNYDKEPATKWMNTDYIQHNLGGYTGLQGFYGLIDFAQSVNATSKNYRLFTDGDYVFAHQAYKFNPSAPAFPVFDVFRFENGKLAEHWEVGDKWNEFEIITGMKDKEIIKSL